MDWKMLMPWRKPQKWTDGYLLEKAKEHERAHARITITCNHLIDENRRLLEEREKQTERAKKAQSRIVELEAEARLRQKAQFAKANEPESPKT